MLTSAFPFGTLPSASRAVSSALRSVRHGRKLRTCQLVGSGKSLEVTCTEMSSLFCDFPSVSRRENPYDAVVFHPKFVGKTLETLPEKR